MQLSKYTEYTLIHFIPFYGIRSSIGTYADVTNVTISTIELNMIIPFFTYFSLIILKYYIQKKITEKDVIYTNLHTHEQNYIWFYHTFIFDIYVNLAAANPSAFSGYYIFYA